MVAISEELPKVSELHKTIAKDVYRHMLKYIYSSKTCMEKLGSHLDLQIAVCESNVKAGREVSTNTDAARELKFVASLMRDAQTKNDCQEYLNSTDKDNLLFESSLNDLRLHEHFLTQGRHFSGDHALMPKVKLIGRKSTQSKASSSLRGSNASSIGVSAINKEKISSCATTNQSRETSVSKAASKSTLTRPPS